MQAQRVLDAVEQTLHDRCPGAGAGLAHERETVIGLSEDMDLRGRGLDAVELATLEWVDRLDGRQAPAQPFGDSQDERARRYRGASPEAG
jgi:hypothetical protein